MKFFSKFGISFDVGLLTLVFFTFFFLPNNVFSESPVFLRSFGLGDKGVDVLRLQQFLNTDPDTRIALSGAGSPGFETDRFGSLTRSAVKKFQKKYASEILFYGQAPTGYVGIKTLQKLNALYGESRADNISVVPISALSVPKVAQQLSKVPPSAESVAPPEVYGVFPNRVKVGDTVTLNGKNFSQTDNTVFLRYAYIEDRFDGLSSVDGKTISFVYQPPKVKTMTEDEFLAMPRIILNQILEPVTAAGGSLEDIVAPYRNMKNETELKDFMEQNGHSFEDLYDYFYVTVENSRGSGSSAGPMLWGMRELRFGREALSGSSFFARVGALIENLTFTQKAYAQGGTPEGGWNSGIIMYCTCSGGFLTSMVDYSTNGGSGLYHFPAGFRPHVGTGMISAPHLGFFRKNGGRCKIYAGTKCINIKANLPVNPWGAAM